jgi:hypothetical protein
MLTGRDVDILRIFSENSGITAKQASEILFSHVKQGEFIARKRLIKLDDNKGLRGVEEC